jgi:hypothetical protein
MRVSRERECGLGGRAVGVAAKGDMKCVTSFDFILFDSEDLIGC